MRMAIRWNFLYLNLAIFFWGQLDVAKNACNAITFQRCIMKEPWQPFVMIMWEPSGSSWETDLLNLHPNVSMVGEMFNPGAPACGSSCVLNACKFLNNEESQPYHLENDLKALIYARGFRVTYSGCPIGFNRHYTHYASSSGNEAVVRDEHIRDACFNRPNPYSFAMQNTSYPPWPNTANSLVQYQFHEYYSLFFSVRPKIICSLRRNAVDLGLARYFRLVLNETCGISRINTKNDKQCWQNFIMNSNFSADPGAILRLVHSKHVIGKLQTRLCEMLSQEFQTFFLWYEDFLANQEGGYRQLLSFLLGTYRRRPHWDFSNLSLPETKMSPVLHLLDDIIVNADEVIHAIEQSDYANYLKTSLSIDYQQHLLSRRQ